MIQEWVQGETGPRSFVLYENGVVFAIPGGATVDLVLIDGTDQTTVIETTGDVVVVDAPNGVVQYSPDADDLVNVDSPLMARFKVTVGGLSAYFPTGEPDTWVIRRI